MPRPLAPLSTAALAAAMLCLACAPARAQTFPLSSDQVHALGVVFAPVQSAQKLDLTVYGRAVPARNAETLVAAPYPGVLGRILAAPGDAVRAGQALARFDSPDYHEALRLLDEARSQAALAGDALQRDTALQADGIIPAARLRATQARVAETRSALRARAGELGSTGLHDGPGGPVITSAEAGTVLEAEAVPGQRVAAGDTLFRLVRTGRMEVEAALPATSVPARPGDAADIPAYDARGSVLSATPSADGSGTLRLRIGISQAGRLRLGQAVAARIHTGSAADGSAPGWRVPAGALVLWRDGMAVFVAGKDTVTLTPVELLSGDDDSAVVRGPLSAGDRVAGAGTAALKGMLMSGDE